MDPILVNIYLGGVITGFIACLLVVAFWDGFRVMRELKREERKTEVLRERNRLQEQQLRR